jgi:hypothetical protein
MASESEENELVPKGRESRESDITKPISIGYNRLVYKVLMSFHCEIGQGNEANFGRREGGMSGRSTAA